MKMLMIIVDEKFRDSVEVVLEENDARGFTEIPTVLGEGTRGKKLGSRLHPGASSIVFSIVADEKVETLKTALLGACKVQQGCAEPIHLAVLPVEQFI
jgi:uncharacterized protein YaaQ